MTDNGTPCAVLRLIVRPHLERGGFHLDRFDAELGGELITTSRQPLLDGARALLARGYDPDAMLTMRHAGLPYDSFQPQPIGELARWTIIERDRGGLQRTRWRPFEDAHAFHAVGSARGDEALADRQAARNALRCSERVPRRKNGMVVESRTADAAAPSVGGAA